MLLYRIQFTQAISFFKQHFRIENDQREFSKSSKTHSLTFTLTKRMEQRSLFEKKEKKKKKDQFIIIRSEGSIFQIRIPLIF